MRWSASRTERGVKLALKEMIYMSDNRGSTVVKLDLVLCMPAAVKKRERERANARASFSPSVL